MCILMTLLFHLTRIPLSILFDQFTLSREESYQLCFLPKLPMAHMHTLNKTGPKLKALFFRDQDYSSCFATEF